MSLLDIPCAPNGLHRAEGREIVTSGLMTFRGDAIEPRTGRKFFLDYPCDLRADEPVTLILNLHGGGSVGNWQRHYFPAVDHKERYRLVVITPTAASLRAFVPGGPEVRVWVAEEDDAFLHALVTHVVDAIGSRNIRAFWLAGHSQGGMTSFRLLGDAFFADRVDGFLSLSGGRIGPAPFVERFGPPKADGTPPEPRPSRLASDPPASDFSFIYSTGEREIAGLPDTSPWAEKYGCGPRERRADIVDTQAGHIWDFGRATYPVWGLEAGPGRAEVFVYPDGRDGRIVADVVRLEKGHTEGLEPKVTEALIAMITAAPGGKLAALG
jgi:pimeloyl-ACP methyl ester carboxylesterase